jgi:hypothetical protein
MDDELLMTAESVFRAGWSEVTIVGFVSDAAGAPPISVVVTGEAL